MSRTPTAHISDESLQAYLDGELEVEERMGVREHLKICEACSVRLDAWSALFLEIEQLPDLDLVTDLEPAIVAYLSAKGSRRQWTTWMLLGQGVVALSLMMYGWGSLSSALPLGSIRSWLTLPIQTLRAMIDALLPGMVAAFKQFLTWSPSSVDLIVRVPRFASSALFIYAALLIALLWIVGNHYLLRVNGQSEDIRP